MGYELEKEDNIIIPDNNSFVVASRQLLQRGLITLEQHATVLRRAGLRQ